jgi:acetylornithine deacetylase/succinyl-diaminopimelate desuccinylase-like protein
VPAWVIVCLASALWLAQPMAAQRIDWTKVGEEATRLLQDYVKIDTSNPPGDTRKAADFLAAIFEREGIPVTRYESAPQKAILYARLKATVTPPAGKAIVLLHHMDVVPADRARWHTDPFTPTIQGHELWGRGSMDMIRRSR